ncbi:AB hydrolase superfamily protein YfhM-like isoform X2 [Rhipicephalus sanguineus]|uniref:AB hydrolase superfamily protein YfhM-like isoform X2 n=1 Tax=Rhipicephalus sanguineus TaxID=34632 RepID=UPI0018937314|nr:AB hydrolase superfamily protein YfhM-like isoform X2 [Rhipicephalus sanguineus]
MVFPPALAKIMILTIGISMWIWMQAYVKVQVVLYGRAILEPHRRSEPPELKNIEFGQHEYRNVNGIAMHYVHKGCDASSQNGPILLLLHGFLDFWFIWNRQIPILSKKFCVIVPDLRGYGLTTKPANSTDYLMVKLIEDVRQLLLTINPPPGRPLLLVGHDWGAMIGFCLASLEEHLIDRMIVINGMHPKAFQKQLLRSPRQMRMSWYMIPFRHPEVPEQYLMMRDFAFFDKVHKGFTKREEYVHKYMFSQPGALTGAINYYRAFNNDKEQLNKLQYRVLDIPTLILWGQKDEFLTSRVGKYDREWLNKSAIVFYKRAGHWLMRECFDTVNQYILDFVKYGLLDPSLRQFNNSKTQNENTCAHSVTPGVVSPPNVFPLVPLDSGVPGFPEE